MANILVIDDEPLICRFLSEEITLMGHTVASAATRREGLDKALSRSFDVVFLDVRLPDGSSLATLPRIREGFFPPEFPTAPKRRSRAVPGITSKNRRPST